MVSPKLPEAHHDGSRRLLLLATPPLAEAGEWTEKGGINQRAVLANRAVMVTRLLSATPPAEVIAAANSAISQQRHEIAK